MSSIIDYPEYENQEWKGKLLLSIWTKPSKTLEFILRRSSTRYEHPLFLMIAAIASIEDIISAIRLEWAFYGMRFCVHILIFWAILNCLSWGLMVTGTWMQRKARLASYQAILAWSLVPIASSILVWIPYLTIDGLEGNLYFTWSFQGLTLGLAIWSLVILIKGIQLIQGFSTLKSVLNILVAGILILVPIFYLLRFISRWIQF